LNALVTQSAMTNNIEKKNSHRDKGLEKNRHGDIGKD